MKLYCSPGACSQAPHILLHEIGLDHDAARVDLKAKTLEDGSDYLKVNPKGAVPALQLDSGEVLTENAVVLQYLGDRAGWPEVLPPLGNFRRYRVLEMVNFITTELHKRFGFLFSRDATDEMNSSSSPSSARSSTTSTSAWAMARSCSAMTSRCPTHICSSSPAGPKSSWASNNGRTCAPCASG